MEYKILVADNLINEDQLNDLAQQGWRLVTIATMHGQYYFYFSRIVAN